MLKEVKVRLERDNKGSIEVWLFEFCELLNFNCTKGYLDGCFNFTKF